MAHEKKIAGALYRFEELLGWEAFDALQTLARVVAPYTAALEAVEIADATERDAALARMLPSMLRDHDGGALRALIEALSVNLRADGDPAVIGVKPASLDEMTQVFAWAIGAQFGNFFGGAGLASLLGSLKKG
jgi:hypothetical protein